MSHAFSNARRNVRGLKSATLLDVYGGSEDEVVDVPTEVPAEVPEEPVEPSYPEPEPTYAEPAATDAQYQVQDMENGPGAGVAASYPDAFGNTQGNGGYDPQNDLASAASSPDAFAVAGNTGFDPQNDLTASFPDAFGNVAGNAGFDPQNELASQTALGPSESNPLASDLSESALRPPSEPGGSTSWLDQARNVAGTVRDGAAWAGGMLASGVREVLGVSSANAAELGRPPAPRMEVSNEFTPQGLMTHGFQEWTDPKTGVQTRVEVTNNDAGGALQTVEEAIPGPAYTRHETAITQVSPSGIRTETRYTGSYDPTRPILEQDPNRQVAVTTTYRDGSTLTEQHNHGGTGSGTVQSILRNSDGSVQTTTVTRGGHVSSSIDYPVGHPDYVAGARTEFSGTNGAAGGDNAISTVQTIDGVRFTDRVTPTNQEISSALYPDGRETERLRQYVPGAVIERNTASTPYAGGLLTTSSFNVTRDGQAPYSLDGVGVAAAVPFLGSAGIDVAMGRQPEVNGYNVAISGNGSILGGTLEGRGHAELGVNRFGLSQIGAGVTFEGLMLPAIRTDFSAAKVPLGDGEFASHLSGYMMIGKDGKALANTPIGNYLPGLRLEGGFGIHRDPDSTSAEVGGLAVLYKNPSQFVATGGRLNAGTDNGGQILGELGVNMSVNPFSTGAPRVLQGGYEARVAGQLGYSGNDGFSGASEVVLPGMVVQRSDNWQSRPTNLGPIPGPLLRY